MQVFSDHLAECMVGEAWQVSQYNPISRLERYAKSAWVMRYLRYLHYPLHVLSSDADIHHVVDHGYAHLRPWLGQGKTCITVHDLIPLLTHRGLIESQPTRRPWLNEHSLSFINKFDQITVPSKSTADDVTEHLAINSDRISIVPPVIADRFRPLPAKLIAEFADHHNLDTDCQWLMISGQEFYKNHPTSLKVLKRLRKDGAQIKLLKTGVSTDFFRRSVAKLGLENAVQEVFLPQASELPKAYNFVDCLLFPSLYEGFGMPVAEALACGTSVVSSDRGSLPEVGGSLVRRASPYDVSGLSEAVSEALRLGVTNPTFKEMAQTLTLPYRPAQAGEQWRRVYQLLSG